MMKFLPNNTENQMKIILNIRKIECVCYYNVIKVIIILVEYRFIFSRILYVACKLSCILLYLVETGAYIQKFYGGGRNPLQEKFLEN